MCWGYSRFVCTEYFARSIYFIPVLTAHNLVHSTTIFCILNVHLNNCLIFPIVRAKNVDELSSGPEIIRRVIERAGLESKFHFFIKIIHYLWNGFVDSL
jgi:hypothetical protein